MKAGTEVVIIEDCRENGVIPGTLATYDGEFPLSVALTNDGGETFFKECDYEAFVSHGGGVFLEHCPLWEGGEKPGDRFAMVMRNPRMTLPDGSKIWGAECWWRPADEGAVDLPKEQAEIENFKTLARAFMLSKEDVTK